MRELGHEDELLAGQEVGTLTYLVHDAVTAAGTTLLPFNAQQLRSIAASRRKTDRRDAYWLAKALQSGDVEHAGKDCDSWRRGEGDEAIANALTRDDFGDPEVRGGVAGTRGVASCAIMEERRVPARRTKR